ncbi:MAG: GAF domain-containing protein [Spirochaetota bacterium]
MNIENLEQLSREKGLCLELYEAIASYIVNERGNTRSSVWYYNKHRSGIECKTLFDNRGKDFISGFFIYEEDCPAYFAELAEGRTIIANNARQYPATEDFTDGYFEPNEIFSLLDVPIRDTTGIVRGVICCEHCEELRYWGKEDIKIAEETAKIIGDLLEVA